MKTLLTFAATALLAVPLFAADDAKSDLQAGIKKLADKANYAWTATVKIDGGPAFRLGPTEGKTEKNGWTYTKSSFNDTPYETVSKGEKGALKRGDEWNTVEELESDDRAAWMAKRIKTFKAPAAEAEDLADKVKELQKDAAGVWSGPFTDEGAKALFVMGRRAGSAGPPDAKGSIKFWVKDGVLSKFEYTVQGTIKLPNSDEEAKVSRTGTVEIKEIGTTKVTLPEELKKKLS